MSRKEQRYRKIQQRRPCLLRNLQPPHRAPDLTPSGQMATKRVNSHLQTSEGFCVRSDHSEGFRIDSFQRRIHNVKNNIILSIMNRFLETDNNSLCVSSVQTLNLLLTLKIDPCYYVACMAHCVIHCTAGIFGEILGQLPDWHNTNVISNLRVPKLSQPGTLSGIYWTGRLFYYAKSSDHFNANRDARAHCASTYSNAICVCKRIHPRADKEG